jgi:hypothetical protein
MFTRRVSGCPRWAGKLGSDKADDGVVLIVWVLALTPLIACLAIAINLGMLVEASDNTQNSTDAAALSAVDVLSSSDATYPLVDTAIPIPRSADCRVSGNRLSNCNSASWLDGHYLYYCTDADTADCVPGGTTSLTLLQIVGSPLPGAGEINDSEALREGEAQWECASGGAVHRGHHKVCTQLDTGVSVSGYFALGQDANGSPPLVTAANDVAGLVTQDYQVNPAWSGCPTTALPGGFTLAPLLAAANDCVAYEVTNQGSDLVVWVMTISPTPPSVFAGNFEPPQFRRVAWAFSTLGAAHASEPSLCTGPPSTSGNCP